MGCFSESEGMILPYHEKQDPKMTIATCIDYCNGQENIVLYAGVTSGNTCRCGTQHDYNTNLQKKVPNGQCQLPCGGAKDLYCGGQDDTISIYESKYNDRNNSNEQLD